MNMITGKYVCMVTIDLEVKEDANGLKPFDEIKDAFLGDGLTDAIREIMFNEFSSEDGVDCTVVKIFGNIRRGE